MGASPDLTEFFKYSQPKRRPCAVAFIREQLDGPQQAQLEAAMKHDPGLITNAAIHRWLADRGHELTVASVVAHRKGTCHCGR